VRLYALEGAIQGVPLNHLDEKTKQSLIAFCREAKACAISKTISADMFAPCGMNCALCIGHQRAKKPCAGCRGDIAEIHPHCQKCVIRGCESRKNGFCYACDSFPCKRLKQLDVRYRKNYGMSMIQNLRDIAEMGLDAFIRCENTKWACPSCGHLLSVHREQCQNCGATKNKENEDERIAFV
jgi:hypothetical protein